jgi:CHRD domain-containing protein
MRKRSLSMGMAALGLFAIALFGSYATADRGKGNVKSNRMSSYLEVPSISTGARGSFEAKIDGSTISYKLEYSGLSTAPLFAHIHFGQRSANGGVSAFLCGGGGKAACPTSGTVNGTIVAADVIGPAGQGITAGEIAELIAAIRAGRAYANVHTTAFPGGELRGQINDDNQKDD